MTHPDSFTITVEVVPPDSADPNPLLSQLKQLAGLEIDGFSVATNPMAKPRMHTMAFSALIQQQIGKPATPHCTCRDHNRLGIFSLLSGIKALGLETVLISTGDYVALQNLEEIHPVHDMNVFEIIKEAQEMGLKPGVVLSPCPGYPGFGEAVRRLEKKVEVGAQYIVTQPVYDAKGVDLLLDATRDLKVPLLMGILPLRTVAHAGFLNHHASGISVPKAVRERLDGANDPAAEGVAIASEMLAAARESFDGAYIMPSFDHYDAVADILG